MAIAAVLASCGSVRVNGSASFTRTYSPAGVMVSENRDVDGFGAIKFKGISKADVRIGSGFSVKLETDKNLMQYVECQVENGTLVIGLDNSDFRDIINAEITLPMLVAISNMGSGEIRVLDDIDCSEFGIEQAGSGNVYLSGNIGNANFSVSGSGSIHASGSTKVLSGRVSGSGAISCKNLHADEANVMVSGSGRVDVNAHNALNISISGSGKVYYDGNPVIRKSISGSGSVIRLGE